MAVGKEYTFYILKKDGTEHEESNLTLEESNVRVREAEDCFMCGTYLSNLEEMKRFVKKQYGVE
jgi:hypothetical protein